MTQYLLLHLGEVRDSLGIQGSKAVIHRFFARPSVIDDTLTGFELGGEND